MKLEISDYVQRTGYQSVVMEDMIQDMTPKATSMVPDKIRRDLMTDVQRFPEKNCH